jgi:hypothetical protein
VWTVERTSKLYRIGDEGGYICLLMHACKRGLWEHECMCMVALFSQRGEQEGGLHAGLLAPPGTGRRMRERERERGHASRVD